MKNYQVNKNLGVVRIPFNLTADNSDAFDEMRKETRVNNLMANEVTAINDYEITAFRPLVPSTGFSYDIYFHRRIDTTEPDPKIRNILSAPYVKYYDDIVTYFATPFFADPMSTVSNIRDFVTGTTYPTFWNSLCYPFYTRKDTWYLDKEQTLLKSNRFDPNSYMYNSFIKMNFYTTPYAATQELLFQNIIYVNPRWCTDYEGDANGRWHRPKFYLNEATDGYYLYWLGKYNISTFYVNFQFWDALNGRIINLIPTSSATPYKQWVQGVNTTLGFDSRMMYMEYKVKYGSRTYMMGEFDITTNQWSLHSSDIKLYELIFDNYFAPLKPPFSPSTGEVTQTTVIPPSSIFNITLNGFDPTSPNILHLLDGNENLTELSSTPGLPMTFNKARSILDSDALNLSTYKKTLTIKNNSEVEVYLKDIQVIDISQSNSTSQSRIFGDRKDRANALSTYTFLTVPDADHQFYGWQELDSNPSLPAMQPNFDAHYDILQTDNTIADANDVVNSEGCTSPNGCWWNSHRMLGWYYPMTGTSFNSWSPAFGEKLFVQHAGDDLEPIMPNGTLDLILSWGVGEHYSTVYIEPYFYKLTTDLERHKSSTLFFSVNYHVDLTYTIKLIFNNLQNTLSDTSITFQVPVTYSVKYKYDSGSGGGGDDDEPGGKPGHEGQP